MRKIKGRLNKKAYTTFMDLETQCYKDINSFQINFRSVKPQQLFCKHLQADSTFYIEIQRTKASQGNLECEEQSKMTYTTRYHYLL